MRGDTNIYTPYLIIEENDNVIHLSVSAKRKFLFVFTFNIMPLVILCLVPLLFIFSNGNIPFGYIVLIATCSLIVAIALFFKKAIHEVVISAEAVEIISVKSLKKSSQTVSLKDVARIYLEVYLGRGGGSFFRLVLNTGRKVEFITIPILFMERQNIRLICLKLKEITGLDIETDLIGTEIIGESDQY